MGANADVVRGYIDAISTGDLEGIASRLSDDVIVHIGGHNPTSGDHTKDRWVSMFGSILDRSGGSMDVEVHDVLESGDHVVALVRRSLAGVDTRAAVIYHVSDGSIGEIWSFEGDQAATDQALGG